MFFAPIRQHCPGNENLGKIRYLEIFWEPDEQILEEGFRRHLMSAP